MPNTSHTYRVKSKNTGGDSGFSTLLTKYTAALAPNSGSIGSITAQSINASWNQNTNPESTYFALGVFGTDGTLVIQNPWTTGLNDIVTGLASQTSYIV